MSHWQQPFARDVTMFLADLARASTIWVLFLSSTKRWTSTRQSGSPSSVTVLIQVTIW